MSANTRTSIVLLALNLALFGVKLSVGLLFGSLAVLSDAFNSLVDIVTSIVIYFAIRMGSQPADSDHPFGHARAEPLAAFTVSILTFVLAFEVLRAAFDRILSGEIPEAGLLPIYVLLGVIAVKSFMWLISSRAHRTTGSPALRAAAIDSKMDIVISLFALVGVAGVSLGHPELDAYAAFVIALWIGYAGWSLGKENIEKLLGQCPDSAIMRLIREKLNVFKKKSKIQNFHDLRVHYVGSDIHVSVHVTISKKHDFQSAHNLEEEIQEKLKSVAGVENAAVHVDPA